MYNKNHAAMRLIREQAPTVDVVLDGHTHVPAGAWEFKYAIDSLFSDNGASGVKHYIKVGSAMKDDPFSWRHFGPGVFGAPTIVFSGREHHIEQFQRPSSALAYIKGCRG